ncbi:hypothetical protein BBP40_005295 [Aspergillus hancockii]|nr:hypothetical protein BBP40_005295 [Aspergillus hancockii]
MLTKNKYDYITTDTAVLASTGTVSPDYPTMKDDIATVRTYIKKWVLQGRDVFLVLHSAGAFIGSEAMEGLSKQERKENGENEGVVYTLFLAGVVVEEGHEHHSLPSANVDGEPRIAPSRKYFLSMICPKERRQNG